MAVNPMLSSGAASMVEAVRSATSAAQEVAQNQVDQSLDSGAQTHVSSSSETPSGIPDQAEAIVALEQHSRQVQASAKVVHSADAVLGFLLDTSGA